LTRHRIEQTAKADGQRVSVSTEMLLHRGPVVLRLDYVNYVPKTAENALRAYNMEICARCSSVALEPSTE
jgi:hypothetical protein